jgi:hypothetical protein
MSESISEESKIKSISELEKTEREFEPEIEHVNDAPVKQTRFYK